MLRILFFFLFIPFSLFAAPLKILFLGDSLTAGYRLKPEAAYPQLVEKIWKQEGLAVSVINGGVSGDTTTGGLRRLDWMLRSNPDFMIIALGANDMLRGIAPEISKKNLEKIILKAQQKKIRLALFGMKSVGNMGRRYETAFNAIFGELAKKYKIPFLPFFLAKVATRAELNLSDGIHPNEAGHRLIASDVAAFLKPFILEQLQ